MTKEYSIKGTTLRQRIEIPESFIRAWQDDYANMRRFFIYGESLEFNALMLRIEELQKRVAQLQGKIRFTLLNNFITTKTL